MLSEEERNVLILGAKHLTNKQIAGCLGMSVVKVKTLFHDACIKLGTRSRYAASWRALSEGYVTIDEFLSSDELVSQKESLDILLRLNLDLVVNVLQELAQIVFSPMPQVWIEREARENVPPIYESTPYTDSAQGALLTKAERDALALVGQGLTNSQIAEKLFLTSYAVRNALSRAASKLGVHGRAQAFMTALRKGDILLSDAVPPSELVWFFARMKPESLERVARSVLWKWMSIEDTKMFTLPVQTPRSVFEQTRLMKGRPAYTANPVGVW